MKVSIITVVYNDVEGLKRTIPSVLNQRSNDYEYIILDGGSTDGTLEYLSSLSIKGKIKSEPDTGIYNAMNKAANMAEGAYVLFMNAGDTFYDHDVLSRAIPLLGDADLYVGHTIERGGEQDLIGKAPARLSVRYLVEHSIYHQSTFIRTSLLRQHPYNEGLKIVSDWEFFFEQWLKGCTYKQLNFFISNYYLGGFSFQHKELLEQERNEVISRLLPQRLIDDFVYEAESKTKLEEKIEIAMTLPPIQRDLKILRNAFKWLMSDIF